MNYIVIRTCPKDDYLARLCYESFKHYKVPGRYEFFCAHGDYKWVKETSEPMKYHMECANFGGQRGAFILLRHMKQYVRKMQAGDTLMIVDADIVLTKNPWDKIYQFKKDGMAMMGGIFSRDIIKCGLHISGQFMLFNDAGLNAALQHYPCGFRAEIDRMIGNGCGIADDTYISAQIPDDRKMDFTAANAWKHHKYYEYEGRTNWAEIMYSISK